MNWQFVRFFTAGFCAVWAFEGRLAVQAANEPDSRFAPLPISTTDPDRGGEVFLKPQSRDYFDDENGGVAGPAQSCDNFGGFGTSFQFSNRYRGNLYRITGTGVVLRSIQMQLAFTGTTNLYVSVHKRNEVDGTYDRHPASSQDVVIQNAAGQGTGTPVFFSTGALNSGQGIELPPGDYAIAYSWGSTTVVYGRDSLIYPRTFRHGSTMGSVALNIPTGTSPPQPPVAENLPPLQVFTSGVYAMQLCFTSLPGACCSGGTCQDVLSTQCSAVGSFFHGERSTCAETPCEFGACCTDKCGGCGNGYTRQACTNAGGVHWSGASCSNPTTALCPKVTGACCIADQTQPSGFRCDDTKCAAECASAGGTYHGDGSDCQRNICIGACCVTGSCFDLGRVTCETFGGTYKGNGTTCATLPPELECGGACCFGTTGLDSCIRVAKRSLCAYNPGGFPFIAYRGDYTACPVTCGQISAYSACCLPDGSCLNMPSQATCESASVQGSFQAGRLCNALVPGATCPDLVKRCCLNDGSCQLLTQTGCTARGGTPITNQTTCSPTACASSGGACCGTATGACTMTTGSLCASQGGLYQGNNSNCQVPATTCPGYGACCKSNGDCFDDFTAAHCGLIAGSFQGPGSFCDAPPVDCDERGACCTITGQCLIVDLATCDEVGGSFIAGGSECSPSCAAQACCFGSACAPRTVAACNDEGGNPQGDGTVCGAESCVPRGGCCHDDTCTVETEVGCGDLPGVYLGDATECLIDSCDSGACCQTDASCEDDVLRGACADPGQSFYFGETCGGGTFSCIATPTGACCNETTCVPDMTETDCTTGGGTYKGDDVLCDVNTCPSPCSQIVTVTPPNCAIDARQPFPSGNPGTPQGWNTLTFTLNCADTSSLTAGDFAVTVTPTGTAPTVSSVTPNGSSITVNLSGPILPGSWTCVELVPAQQKRCLGFLPADVNSNRASAPGDILDLIDNLNGVRVPALLLHQCDLDRSNQCAPVDILSEIDMLNGASGFAVWNGRTLPVCPSAVP